MSLTKCPDCKNQISDAAPACPHCGRPRLRTSDNPTVGDLVKDAGKAVWSISLRKIFLTGLVLLRKIDIA